MFEEKVGDKEVKAYFESMDLDVWDATWPGYPGGTVRQNTECQMPSLVAFSPADGCENKMQTRDEATGSPT